MCDRDLLAQRLQSSFPEFVIFFGVSAGSWELWHLSAEMIDAVLYPLSNISLLLDSKLKSIICDYLKWIHVIAYYLEWQSLSPFQYISVTFHHEGHVTCVCFNCQKSVWLLKVKIKSCKFKGLVSLASFNSVSNRQSNTVCHVRPAEADLPGG